MDSPSAPLRARILKHMNAWGEAANVLFAETNGTGEVRIARLDIAGRDGRLLVVCGHRDPGVGDDEPTLNLEGFTMKTAESEFRRVVRHEAGHTLGFDHEHMRAAIVSASTAQGRKHFFGTRVDPGRGRGAGADSAAEEVDHGTNESDPLSIMCYHLPGAIMKDGEGGAGRRRHQSARLRVCGVALSEGLPPR